MPFFSSRCSTSSHSCSVAIPSAIAPVPSGEPSSTTSTRNPSGAAPASTSADALTIAMMFSASLYVGNISQGSPLMGRRTLERGGFPRLGGRPANTAAPYPESVAQPELSNTAIAAALEELGDLYELDGAIVHRVVAYRSAAKSVRDASVSVAALAREGRATELPGIGATLQEKILALVQDGTIPAAEKLRAKFPAGLIAITRLPGLGPKRARLLHTELGIDSPQALREAVQGQRLRTVRGLGPKLEERLLQALEEMPEGAEMPPAPRMLLPQALELGEALVQGLLRRGGRGTHVELAGSLRRMADSVKDLDLIATTTRPAELARGLAELEEIETVSGAGTA